MMDNYNSNKIPKGPFTNYVTQEWMRASETHVIVTSEIQYYFLCILSNYFLKRVALGDGNNVFFPISICKSVKLYTFQKIVFGLIFVISLRYVFTTFFPNITVVRSLR